LRLTKERWTVLKVIEWTQGYLRARAIPSPRLESELLLSHALGLDRVGLYLHHDMVLSPSELERFRELIKRRTRGEPLPYITGYKEFWSIPFRVDPSVLIPRPETEVLVEEALRIIGLEGWTDPLVLDLGTGCGAIAVSLAKSISSGRIVATDLSWEALALARENALAQGVSGRICFVQGDGLSFMKSTAGIFDQIVSNPPYVSHEEIESLQPEIRDFEPRHALDGGPDGLEFHRELLSQVPSRLKSGGWLIVEIGAGQGPKILESAEKASWTKRVRIIRDYAGRSRALVAQKR